jgi:molybdopterin/thiamine biosynthesis adenylyltransferase
VLGSAPALAASIQSIEAIKYLAGMGFSLEGKLLSYDGANGKFDIAGIAKNPKCPACVK